MRIAEGWHEQVGECSIEAFRSNGNVSCIELVPSIKHATWLHSLVIFLLQSIVRKIYIRMHILRLPPGFGLSRLHPRVQQNTRSAESWPIEYEWSGGGSGAAAMESASPPSSKKRKTAPRHHGE